MTIIRQHRACHWMCHGAMELCGVTKNTSRPVPCPLSFRPLLGQDKKMRAKAPLSRRCDPDKRRQAVKRGETGRMVGAELPTISWLQRHSCFITRKHEHETITTLSLLDQGGFHEVVLHLSSSGISMTNVLAEQQRVCSKSAPRYGMINGYSNMFATSSISMPRITSDAPICTRIGICGKIRGRGQATMRAVCLNWASSAP